MTSKFALVIANTEYQDASFAKLTAPGKDAEEFAQILRDVEFAAFDDVQVLINEGEGKTRRSIARFFGERKPADLLLLYFSGHGVRNEQGQLFLAANDTEISILEATGIPAEFITRAMNNSRSQRQLLILDCCNSGAFAYGSKSASGLGKSMGIATAFEGDGYGRVVLTATDATQFAWEGDKVIGNTQNSVFTHFLIEGLKGEADRDGDGRIKVDELYDYAYEQVVRRTPKQTPGKWSYKQQGDIVLRENLKPRDVKPAPLPSELLEMLSHPSSTVRRAGLQDLISLLDGKHLGLARAAQEKLREIAENDDSLSLRRLASDTLIARGLQIEQPAPSSTITPSVKAEPLATSIEALNESTPDIPRPVKSRKKLASEHEKPLDEHVMKQEKIARKLSADVEAPKKEPREVRKAEKRTTTPPLGDDQRAERAEVVREKTPRTTPARKSSASSLNFRLIGIVVGGVLIISLLIWGGSKLLLNLPAITSEPTHTFQSNVTFTSQPNKTDTPLATRTSIPLTQTTMPQTSELGIGSTMTGKDGIVLLYVPAGEFTMGKDTGGSNERPEHAVYLDAFWIDKTEVTNKMYALCVSEGKCQEPANISSSTRSAYFGNSEFDDYPVIYVDWNMAKTYCEWANRRLPTEAEWEKAARGDDARNFPWGNNSPHDNLLNFNSHVGDTTKVGSYLDGASPYGALDMAGNVWEWVADWYRDYYYVSSPASNPSGPASGAYRVLRGGSWFLYRRPTSYGSVITSGGGGFYSWNRTGDSPTSNNYYFGFRCAMSATP